jgi:uncharacterized protein (DUF58 family)
MTIVPSRRLVQWGVLSIVAAAAILIFPGAWTLLVAFDLLLAGAVVLDWLLTPGPAALDAKRLAPERLSVLVDQPVQLVVTNRSRVSLAVRLRETLPEVFQIASEEWTGTVPAGGQARWEYSVNPRARGHFRFGAIAVRYRSVLGLWERQTNIEASAEARVYPNLATLSRYHLLARSNRLEAIGIRKVRLRGGAWEFESLRDYVHGDDVRQIDWKATARRRKPIVRNHVAERNQSVLLLVDCGRLMNAEVDGVSKLDHAVNTALLLAHVALARGDRAGLCTFSHKVHAWVAPRAHLAQNRLLTEALYDLRSDFTETDHGRCLRLISSRYPKRALLVVLTDFVDAQTAADMIAHLQLASRRYLVLFAALKDPFLARAAHARSATALDGFRQAAAVELLRERREVLERLRQMGAHVLDAEPAGLTPPVVNRYLEITSRGLL